MARITQKQVDSINFRCTNGFTFYIRGFMEDRRKQLIKTITLEENEKVVEAKLCWLQEIAYQKNPHGCGLPYRTGFFIPELRVSVWCKSKRSGAWVSGGFGNRHEFKDYSCAKKLLNVLCEVSKLATDELICLLLPDEECQEFKALANLK